MCILLCGHGNGGMQYSMAPYACVVWKYTWHKSTYMVQFVFPMLFRTYTCSFTLYICIMYMYMYMYDLCMYMYNQLQFFFYCRGLDYCMHDVT